MRVEVDPNADRLEGQQAAVRQYVNGHGQLIGEYQEVETGTSKREWTEIHKAIAHARRAKATLVIAKLDRPARNLASLPPCWRAGWSSSPATTLTPTG